MDYIRLPGHGSPHLALRPEKPVCGAEDCRRSPDHLGDYMQNLVAHAQLMLRGVTLLLDHGAGGHINANVLARGTPLSRFLVFAAEARMRRRFLTRHPTFAALGEICDLLIDAGAQIPLDGYEDGAAGVPRLLRLPELHAMVLNEEGEKGQATI
ncbi:hypothetical protein DL770_001299 [Monosporascus sp. CRB-9-2]|nr:hypothetical protein DL770_001299 [Monosporascus sp. CRB-9-2]